MRRDIVVVVVVVPSGEQYPPDNGRRVIYANPLHPLLPITAHTVAIVIACPPSPDPYQFLLFLLNAAIKKKGKISALYNNFIS